MKIILFFAVFLFMSTSLFCQYTKKDALITSDDYIKKSKQQEDTGYWLLGLGAAAIGIPLIIWATDDTNESDLESLAGPISMLVGAGMMISSIPFFVASENNKIKGMSLSIKNEAAPYFRNGNQLTESVPALSLKVGL